MWKAVYDSVTGTSHQGSEIPCQDACRVMELGSADRELFVACLADGAGSALHAGVGAEVACDAFIRIVGRDTESVEFGESADGEFVLAWCREMRAQIEERAAELDVELRQLACTFLGAVVAESGALFLQIGDGAIVRWNGGGYSPVFWPQSGEFANTTNFLTDEEFGQRLEYCQWAGRVDELAIFSDGLERLILRFADRTVHDPFLTPLFEALRQSEDPDDYFQPLRTFLDSPAVNERTDDDKTLILATRLQ
jgi:hypothetical protein